MKKLQYPGGNGGALLPGLPTAVYNIQHTYIHKYIHILYIYIYIYIYEFVFVKFYKFGLDISSFVFSRKETT